MKYRHITGESLCRKCDLQDKPADHLIYKYECLHQGMTETLRFLTKGHIVSQNNLVRKMLKCMELMGLPGDF